MFSRRRYFALTGIVAMLLSAPLTASASVDPVEPASTASTSYDPQRAISLNAQIQVGTLTEADLSPRDRALLAQYATPVRIDSTQTEPTTVALTDPATKDAVTELEAAGATAATITCKSQRYERIAYGSVNNKLYMSYHVGKWCYSTSGSVSIATVTSSSWLDGGGQTYWLGWENLGLINKGAGIVSGKARSFSQQSFKFTWGPTTQSVQPCVRLTAVATSSKDYTCGIY